MKLALLLAVFACELVLELLVVAWHSARERRRPGRSAAVAGVMGLLAVPPVWLSIEMLDPVYLFVGVAGSVAGSYIGVRMLPKHNARRSSRVLRTISRSRIGYRKIE